MPSTTEQNNWTTTFLDRKLRARRENMDSKSQEIAESQQRQIALAGGIMNLLEKLKSLSADVRDYESKP